MSTKTKNLLNGEFVIVGIDMKGRINQKVFFDDKDRQTNQNIKEHVDNLNSKNNTLIFFPSECHHRVLSHKSDKIRYAIAFNLIPKGKLGIEGEDSFLVLWETLF